MMSGEADRGRWVTAPSLAPGVAAIWRRHPHARLAVLLIASYNVALGTLLAVGGPSRVATASFASVRDTFGPVGWGALLLALGLAVLGSALVSRRGVAWVLGTAALAHLFLAGGFLVAALDRPDAALTGPATYMFIAGSHAVQCVLHRRPLPARA